MKIVLALLIAIFLLSGCGVSQESKNPTGNKLETKNEIIPEKEKTDTNSNMDSLDSIPAIDHELMSDKQLVNGWVYFLYPKEFQAMEFPDAYSLFRRREDGTELTRLTTNRCDEYTVLDDCVYYAGYTPDHQHGKLYVIKPDEEPLLLADELCDYQIVDNHI